jgi:hypothetical protein
LTINDEEIVTVVKRCGDVAGHAVGADPGSYNFLRHEWNDVVGEKREMWAKAIEAAANATLPSETGEWWMLQRDPAGTVPLQLHSHSSEVQSQRFHLDLVCQPESLMYKAGETTRKLTGRMFLAFVSLTDGFRIKIASPPGTALAAFWEAEKQETFTKETMQPHATALNRHLASVEEEWKAAKDTGKWGPLACPMVRAGTVVFGPAEAFVHAAVGAGGVTCNLTGSTKRVVLLVPLVPLVLHPMYSSRADLTLETPLGLFRDITGDDLVTLLTMRRLAAAKIKHIEAALVAKYPLRTFHPEPLPVSGPRTPPTRRPKPTPQPEQPLPPRNASKKATSGSDTDEAGTEIVSKLVVKGGKFVVGSRVRLQISKGGATAHFTVAALGLPLCCLFLSPVHLDGSFRHVEWPAGQLQSHVVLWSSLE